MSVSHGDFPQFIARTEKKTFNMAVLCTKLAKREGQTIEPWYMTLRAAVCTTYSEVSQKSGKPSNLHRFKRALPLLSRSV